MYKSMHIFINEMYTKFYSKNNLFLKTQDDILGDKRHTNC